MMVHQSWGCAAVFIECVATRRAAHDGKKLLMMAKACGKHSSTDLVRCLPMTSSDLCQRKHVCQLDRGVKGQRR